LHSDRTLHLGSEGTVFMHGFFSMVCCVFTDVWDFKYLKMKNKGKESRYIKNNYSNKTPQM
jgi:hypothetical protein